MRLLALLCLVCSTYAAIVGIDLGHQFTKAMVVAPGLSFEIVLTDEGQRKDLSAISLRPLVNNGELKDAERVFGSQIGSLCSRFPDSCASHIKSLLGKGIDDTAVREYLNRHHGVRVVADESRASVKLDLGPAGMSAEFSIEELMAMSLNELKDRVLKVLTHHPQAKAIAEDVAVSIPPYAAQVTRNAYLDALHLANYSTVLGLVDEGTAVALGYISGRKLTGEEYDGKTVYHIVYDVGAGSTTATLFSYTPFENQTIVLDIESIGHDEHFGGELLTRSVYDILFGRFLQQFKLDDDFVLSPKLASRLSDAAEKTKIILSANTEYKVSLESFYDDQDFKAVISRDEFEEITIDLVERITKPILEALKDSPSGSKTVADIQSVILHGGSTRVPFVQKQLLSLLGDEEKIAKVVNADEACALGTTFRGYHLKMINSNPSNIILKDRIFSNFEISVNDFDTQTVIFEKGSTASNTTEVSLGLIKEDLVEVGLYEQGGLFSTYTVDNLLKKSLVLTCKKGVELYGTFKVDVNKMFSLSSLALKCAVAEASEETTETKSANSSTLASNSTIKKTKPRTQTSVFVPGAKFTTLRPLTSDEKKTSSKKLTHLKQRDTEKISFDETKNLLESGCYELRSFIEDNFSTLAAEIAEETLEEFQATAGETVQWLEFDSDGASLDEIKEKYAVVSGHKKTVEDIMKMLETDLSLKALKFSYKEGSEISLQVQEYLLEYGSQISTIRKQYEEEGFDFDKENEKVMKLMSAEGKDKGLNLDVHYKDFKEALKGLSATIELPKKEFKKLTKRALYQTHSAVTNLIMTMMEDVLALQGNHERRINFLLDKYLKMTERKNQKIFRQKMKEERDQAEKEAAEKVEREELGDFEAPVEDDGKFASGSFKLEDISIDFGGDIKATLVDSEQESRTMSAKESTETAEEVGVHDEL